MGLSHLSRQALYGRDDPTSLSAGMPSWPRSGMSGFLGQGGAREMETMTDADIENAICKFESLGDCRHGRDALFRDPKTRRFWEIVYPPDGGPRVLKAITAHDARSKYHQAFSDKKPGAHDYWLDGETLQSVTFIHDYWQLQFHNSSISAFTKTDVQSDGATVRDGDDQFRNRQCDQIGTVVESFEVEDSIACTIKFDDQSSISMSLKEADYEGPEAVNVSAAGQVLMVF
jgi:hypothetical protein